MSYTDSIKSDIDVRKIARLQNLCGATFIIMHAFGFVLRLLQYNDILPYDYAFGNLVLGVLGLLGFILLSRLSSSIAGDFFTGCQIGMKAFFAVALPMLVLYFSDDSDLYEPVFWLCIGFSVLSVYFWAMLLYNVKFRVCDKVWIVLLPLMNIYNICHYFNCLSRVNDTSRPFEGAFYDIDAMMILRLCLIPIMAIGYWKLSHTKAFSGPKDNFDMPKMSPINIYFLSYCILIISAYYAF